MAEKNGMARRVRAAGCACVATLATASAAHGGTVLYVDDDAPPGGDGAGWKTAYHQLHLALAVADSGTEIRVAGGTYLPDPEEGDREATFQLANGVSILGGYAGLGAEDPDARDLELYPTVLSGDLEGNDGPNFENYEDNSRHVVTGSFVNTTAELDGVTITAGHADGPMFPETGSVGGGLLAVSGAPTVTRCRFVANLAREAGAGMANLLGANTNATDCLFSGNRVPTAATSAGAAIVNAEGANGTFTRCRFVGNRADIGGALAAQACEPTFVDCTFEDGIAMIGGGAAVLDGGLTFVNCRFEGNYASAAGGGFYAATFEPGSHSPTLFGCVFVDNESFDGGAIVNDIGADTAAVNCTFSGNGADEKAGGTGGAALNAAATPLFRNCILWGNVPNEVVDVADAAASLKYCLIAGGWSGSGTNNIDADPLFADPGANDVHLTAGSPAIDAGDNNGVLPGVLTDPDGAPRFAEDPCVENTGSPDGVRFAVDLGAYEYQPPCRADVDCSGTVDFGDVLALLVAWGACGACVEDLDGDGRVSFEDVLIALGAWGDCG